MEGTILGIRSIALSLMMGFEDGERRALWETATAHAPSLISKLLEDQWHPGTLLNVNFPDVPPDEVDGIAVTTQGVRDAALLNIDSRSDPWGTPYFWFGFERRKSTLGARNRPRRDGRKKNFRHAVEPRSDRSRCAWSA